MNPFPIRSEPHFNKTLLTINEVSNESLTDASPISVRETLSTPISEIRHDILLKNIKDHYTYFSYDMYASSYRSDSSDEATVFMEPDIPNQITDPDIPTSETCMNDPLVNDPPVNDPPVNDPPVNDPPVNEPPVNDPLVNDPLVNDPPINDPPVNDPPVNDPPVNDPLVNESSANKVNSSETNPLDNSTATHMICFCCQSGQNEEDIVNHETVCNWKF